MLTLRKTLLSRTPSLTRPIAAVVSAVVLVLTLGLVSILTPVALGQSLDNDPSLDPQLDPGYGYGNHHHSRNQQDTPPKSLPDYEGKPATPPNVPGIQQDEPRNHGTLLNQQASAGRQVPLVLKGSVRTLEAAITVEKDVDWYQWYMNARNYLTRNGGLQCPLGTSIKFHKNGRIEANSPAPVCQASVAWKRFPLPQSTSLDAIVLPVRSSDAPPASREELLKHLKNSGPVF